jgi:hypothetical protein
MLEMPNTTLVCADCVEVARAVRVIERCKALAKFAAVKFFTDLPTDYEHAVKCEHLGSLSAYSAWCLTRLYRMVDTPYLLIVQRDGWIINPGAWSNDWYVYGYIGPLYNTVSLVGAGGFSFRHTAFMAKVATLVPEWDGTMEQAEQMHADFSVKYPVYEDVVICWNRPALERAGFRWAPAEVGADFCAGGNRDDVFYRRRPFGFHGSYWWNSYLNKVGGIPGAPNDDGVVDSRKEDSEALSGRITLNPSGR